MRRHPFFLLEVLIATILVFGFAYLSIQGAFGVISKQRKLIKSLETARIEDIDRMDIIATYWNKVDSMDEKEIQEKGYKITCEKGKDKRYLLKLENGKNTYHYLVK